MATYDDWLPAADNALLAWSLNYTTKINADPTSVGLTAIEAANYQTLHDAYAAALATAQNPDTNSHANIVAKNDARAALKTDARSTATTVRSYPSVTNTQLASLGLTVPDPTPSPIPVPDTKPDILIMKTSGNDIEIRLRNAVAPDSRAKPEGVAGASVLYFVGAQPPSTGDIAAWTWMGNTSRTLNTLDFSSTPPGSTIWLTAMWFNTRMDTGPATDPVVVQLPGTYQAAA